MIWGNVWEWCLNEWDRDYYSGSAERNPLAGDANIGKLIKEYNNIGNYLFHPNWNPNPDIELGIPDSDMHRYYRIMRGGSWNHRAHELRVSYRGFSSNPVIAAGSGYGFRCVVDFPKLNLGGKVWDGN